MNSKVNTQINQQAKSKATPKAKAKADQKISSVANSTENIASAENVTSSAKANKTKKSTKNVAHKNNWGYKRQCPTCGIWFYDQHVIRSEPSGKSDNIDVITCPDGHQHDLQEFLKLRHVRTEIDTASFIKHPPTTEVGGESGGSDVIEDTEELADEGEIKIDKDPGDVESEEN